MKKAISVIFISLVFAVLMFSANAYAAELPKVPEIAEKYSGEELFIDMTIDQNGEKINCIVCKKSDKFAFDSDFPIAAGLTAKVRVIMDGENAYMFFPKFPFVYFEFDKEDIEGELDEDILADSEDCMYIGSGTKSLDGKTYYVDIYEYEDVTISYGIENDELVFIESCTEDFRSLVYINEISNSVNDLIFIRPFFAINLSRFISY